MMINKTFDHVWVQNLCIISWILIEEKQLTKKQLQFRKNLQWVKICIDL